jgi:hypothetical protein
MSNFHKSEVSAVLARWLERYSPPMAIKENARAQQDEVEALLSVLLRFAPKNEPGPWVRRALDKLEYQMKTRAWPTKGELGAVCSNMRKEGDTGGSTAIVVDMSDCAVAGRKMQRGDPVSASWLYGRMACELIAGRFVDEETMTKYRSGAFFARRDVYGEKAALAWEAEAKHRHEQAKAGFNDKSQHRGGPVNVNANRMEGAE